MAKTIGRAADFYRLRVMSVDTTDAVDIEWRDDILYRRPPVDAIDDERAFTVEAVVLDEEDVAVALATFADSVEAHDWMEAREVDLTEMTKSEFDAAFLAEGAE